MLKDEDGALETREDPWLLDETLERLEAFDAVSKAKEQALSVALTMALLA